MLTKAGAGAIIHNLNAKCNIIIRQFINLYQKGVKHAMKLQIVVIKPDVIRTQDKMLDEKQKDDADYMGRNFLRDLPIVGGYYDRTAAKQTLQHALKATGLKEVPLIESNHLTNSWLQMENDLGITIPPYEEFFDKPAEQLLQTWGPAWAMREHYRQEIMKIAGQQGKRVALSLGEPCFHPVVLICSYGLLELAAPKLHELTLLKPGEVIKFFVQVGINWNNGRNPTGVQIIHGQKLH